MQHFFPAGYSTLSAEALAVFVSHQYDLPVTECSLFLRGVGDTYLLSESDTRYILRVYRSDQRTLQQIEAEVALLDACRTAGVSVSYGIADKQGRVVQTIHAIEGPRHAVLFSYAAGKPHLILTDRQLRATGSEMARFHHVSASITLPDKRWIFDDETMFNRPLRQVEKLFADDPEGFAWLSEACERSRKQIGQIDSAAFGKGYVHYDFLPKNFHFTDDDRLTFFDFDFFGYGWLVNDLMTLWQQFCLLVDAGRIDQQKADSDFGLFVSAYREHRAVSDEELAMMPDLALGWWVFYLGFYTTHDQFFPMLHPSALRARLGLMRRLTERYR